MSIATFVAKPLRNIFSRKAISRKKIHSVSSAVYNYCVVPRFHFGDPQALCTEPHNACAGCPGGHSAWGTSDTRTAASMLMATLYMVAQQRKIVESLKVLFYH